MRLKNCFKLLPVLLAGVLFAQGGPTLTVSSLPTVKAKKGTTTTVTLHAILPPGFHANSNMPSDAYLIPLTVKWTGGPLQMDAVTYPKPTLEKYSFSDKPLSVVTGQFDITTSFKVPANAAPGPAAENGTIRYQACNDRMCFAAKNVPVTISLNIQ
jgi:hypothetical protein